MDIMYIKYMKRILFLALFVFLLSCEKEEDSFTFGSDCIKRVIVPNIVGDKMEFAYAMAVDSAIGTLTSMEVEASIAGDTATYIDPNSYYTDRSGKDIGIEVAKASTLENGVCKTEFVADTNAATLRYYYHIPEAARGKEVAFTFSAVNSKGSRVSKKMGPYKISKMDMATNIVLSPGNTCYLSIKNLKAYTAADIASNPQLASEIDLIYGFSVTTAIGYALYAPTAPAETRPDVVIPAGVTGDAKMVRVWDVKDQQLSDLQWSVFVDDLDLEKQSFQGGNTALLDLKSQAGVWAESADKTTRAYIFINAADGGNLTVSIKNIKGSF
jgi:hypothetical protein